MAQNSALYAVGRIRALEKTLIGREKLSRLMEGSADDAVRFLSEAGYGSSGEGARDCEQMIANELADAAKLLNEITPDKQLTDLYLMQADMQNVKMLIKLRLQGQTESPAWAVGGIIPKDKLTAAVAAAEYSVFPPVIADALSKLEKELAAGVDPQKLSVAVDRAYIEYVFEALKKHPDEVATAYFKGYADFSNILAMLRMKAMKAEKADVAKVLLPAGDIPHQKLIEVYDLPMENMVKTLALGKAKDDIAGALEEAAKSNRPAVIERFRDDYQIRLVKKHKSENDSVYPVLGYYLAKVQEARNIRLIVTARRNGLSGQVIEERLRELYG